MNFFCLFPYVRIQSTASATYLMSMNSEGRYLCVLTRWAMYFPEPPSVYSPTMLRDITLYPVGGLKMEAFSDKLLLISTTQSPSERRQTVHLTALTTTMNNETTQALASFSLSGTGQKVIPRLTPGASIAYVIVLIDQWSKLYTDLSSSRWSTGTLTRRLGLRIC